MSVFDASMEPMLEMFIYETTTLLEQLDEILINSEKVQTLTTDNINEIFRIMHTIKGSSAMMGLSGISELTHHVEDMFFIIRENPAHMQSGNSSTIFDLLFQSSDFLKSEVESIQQNDNYEPADSSELTALIANEVKVLNGEAPAAAPPTARQAVASDDDTAALDEAEQEINAQLAAAAGSAIADDETLHNIRVYFEDGCQMENIRAFMLLTQLKEVCDILNTDPPSPENNSACSADIVKNGFFIQFKTSLPVSEVYNVIESSLNIKSYESADEHKLANAAVQAVAVQQASASSSSGNSSQAVEKSIEADPVSAVMQQSKINKQSLISVNQTKLDQLMDIMGEIVIAESMVASNPELKGLHLDNFYKSTRQLRKLTDQLQDVVMSIRMVPLSGVFQKMNRIVRDMNKKLGKEVELITVGGDTEVDKTINDILADPFMHMIRNAMDHAIESPEDRVKMGKPEEGRITLAAQNVGGEIVITVADDGRGLNREKILQKAKNNGMLSKNESEYSDKEAFGMIMLPGFSTNEVVTEFSGRGVGMDVVRKNIEKVSGSISVESKAGLGTTFTIKIPLTLAIVDGMEIAVSKDTFTIPITSIKQTFKLSDSTKVINDTNGVEMIMLRGECFPVIRLYNIYGIETTVTNLEDGIFIMVENEQKSACIFADYLIGEQQVVVKPFPLLLSRYNIKSAGLAGCTIMGDGSISLILDINSFLNNY
ncbi:MAG: chemotaxis protein CheA [Hydrogenoanaerobacterium sp.]